MVFHLASTALAIVVAQVHHHAIHQLTFKQTFAYIILCRYYKTHISEDTTSAVPLMLPEHVLHYLSRVLDCSDDVINAAWATSSFRRYVWKSYNSRTETQMSERFINKAKKRGILIGRPADEERADTSLVAPNGHHFEAGFAGEEPNLRPGSTPPELHRFRSNDSQRNIVPPGGNPLRQSDAINDAENRTTNASVSARNSYGSVASSPPRLRGRKTRGQAFEDPATGSTIPSLLPQGTENLQVQMADSIPSPTPGPSSRRLLRHILNGRPHLNLMGKVARQEKGISALGGYANVYKGTYSSGNERFHIAIKQIRLDKGRSEEAVMKNLARELRVWSELDHPNILPLLGYLCDDSGCPSFVSKWMEDGSLRDCLERLTRVQALSMAIDIAEGLAYLHSRGVIHADLKSDNVLVSREKRALLTDFGISRLETLTAGYSTVNVKGNPRWQPKELFQTESGAAPQHTYATDVWAFGMTIYELLSRDKPYAKYNDNQVIVVIFQDILPSLPKQLETADKRTRDNDIEMKLSDICRRCWNFNPDGRPHISHIAGELKIYRAELSRTVFDTHLSETDTRRS